MNSKSLRRLAADHSNLHSEPLPPNYLFPSDDTEQDDLTEFDILLAGPSHTPFANGVWKLHLHIPPEYPQQPPTAHFRTPIFHPNVDPQTGGVCVETLKRDWDSRLTLRDVLVTISCLLIQPNPDSALNAEAGALLQEGFDSFARRAQLMTNINAGVKPHMHDAVRRAQGRDQDGGPSREREPSDDALLQDSVTRPAAPVRRRRTIARQRGAVASRRSDGSPTGGQARRQQQQHGSSESFAQRDPEDDVFRISPPSTRQEIRKPLHSDDGMDAADQENDESLSPTKPATPRVATPRRPNGTAVPLGELTLDELSDSAEDMEHEYPPSPRKSPVKNVIHGRSRNLFETPDTPRPESSRDALLRQQNITPPNFTDTPLAKDSPFFQSARDSLPAEESQQTIPSPGRLTKKNVDLFGRHMVIKHGRIVKFDEPASIREQQRAKGRNMEKYEALWKLCGKDIKRWNKCDFDGDPIRTIASRW